MCGLFLIQEIISENEQYARKQGMYKMLASPDANNTTMPPKNNPRESSPFIPAQQIEQPSQLPKETISLPETKNTIVEKKEEQAPSLPLEPDAKKPIENETVKEDNEQPVKQETQAITSAKEIPEELQKLGDRKTKIEKEHNESTENQIYENGKIEFNFENADLQSLVKQMEELYNITFIADDNIIPLAPGGKPIKGYKISFKTQKPLTKSEAWNLFITFLDLAGFAIVPEADPSMYRITAIPNARKSPVPVYIGVDPSTLPDNDQIIRYVYFIENSSVDTIKGVVDSLRSSISSLTILQEIKAFILTDKSYNIKMLMKIVKELDKVSMPQAMSVIQLYRADAVEVKKLYDTLTKADDRSVTARLFPARKQPTSLYFPENAKIIAEPRTNRLILLGPQDALKKIEDFVTKHVDVDPEKPFSPLHIYELKYADATTIANIMNNVTQFGKETPAGKSGGVRGGDKYFKPMTFISEPTTNTIIIRGDYEDYLKAKEAIAKLDEAQPQLAIEILILAVTVKNKKELGAQIRSKEPGVNGLIGNRAEFQTSGFLGYGIQENTSATKGSTRLLADLVDLAKNASAGNTILTLGSDLFGVWGIFRALQTVSNAQIISNPFLVATNKTKAKVSVGETRRIVTGTIIATEQTETLGDTDAKLDVEITPQINSDGMIVLELKVSIVNFVEGSTQESTGKTIKEIVTKTIVANKEVLALGGLIQNKVNNEMSKTPLLGDIPLLGWLFKNKSKSQTKDNLLILISTQIIEPEKEEAVGKFTQTHIQDYYGTMDEMRNVSERKDPIYRAFFEEKKGSTEKIMDDFLLKKASNKNSKPKKGRNRRLARRRRNKKEQSEKITIAQTDQQKTTESGTMPTNGEKTV